MGNFDWKQLLWVAGRADRKAYWLVLVALIAVGWLCSVVLGSASAATDLLLSWMGVCITARRLHDLGRSGWWQALPALVFTACLVAAMPEFGFAAGLGETAVGLISIVGLVVELGFVIALGVLPGQTGENRFDRRAPAAV